MNLGKRERDDRQVSFLLKNNNNEEPQSLVSFKDLIFEKKQLHFSGIPLLNRKSRNVNMSFKYEDMGNI